MNTHLRLGNAAGPLGLRRQDVVAFCIWVAILIASACVAIAEGAAPDTTFNPAALDSFFASGSSRRSAKPIDRTGILPKELLLLSWWQMRDHSLHRAYEFVIIDPQARHRKI